MALQGVSVLDVPTCPAAAWLRLLTAGKLPCKHRAKAMLPCIGKAFGTLPVASFSVLGCSYTLGLFIEMILEKDLFQLVAVLLRY